LSLSSSPVSRVSTAAIIACALQCIHIVMHVARQRQGSCSMQCCMACMYSICDRSLALLDGRTFGSIRPNDGRRGSIRPSTEDDSRTPIPKRDSNFIATAESPKYEHTTPGTWRADTTDGHRANDDTISSRGARLHMADRVNTAVFAVAHRRLGQVVVNRGHEVRPMVRP
jgi:hypothetical protein